MNEKIIDTINRCNSALSTIDTNIISIKEELMSLDLDIINKEYEIRTQTDFKGLGLTNKESREAYINNEPEFIELLRKKNSLEIDLLQERSEYERILRILKLNNRISDYEIRRGD